MLVPLAALVCLCAAAVRAERLPLRLYTSEDGLGSSAVSNIVADSRGFLWFCTRDGLSRFDGQRFTTYRLPGTTPHVNQIIERRNGDYWVVPQGGGLYRFNVNTHASLSDAPDRGEGALTLAAERVTDADVWRLIEDRAWRLWAVVAGRLCRVVEGEGGRVGFEPVPLRLPGEPAGEVRVSEVREGPDGSLWVVSQQAGVLRLLMDGRAVQYRVERGVPLGNPISTIFVDREGLVWIGQRTGLYVLRPEPPDSLDERAPPRTLGASLPPRDMHAAEAALPARPGEAVRLTTKDSPDAVSGFHQTKDGRVWFTQRDTLSIYDGRRFRTYDRSHGLPSYLGVIAEDTDGNIWMASLSGAVKLVTRGLVTYGQEDGLGEPAIHAIYFDRSGAMHVVNGLWHVSRFDGERFTSGRPRLPAGARFIWTSSVGFLDGSSRWWFLSDSRLYRFPPAREEQLARRRPEAVFDSGGGLKGGAFYRMFEDSRGRLWLSVRSTEPANMGLSVWRPGSKGFHNFSEAEGFPAGRAASAFAEDRAGNVWVGFYHGGLARYDGRRFQTFGEAEGAPKGYVTDLHADAAGRLWVATSEGGVSRVDDPAAVRPAFVGYTTAQGLASDNARALTEDLEGRIYVGTVRGVDRLNPRTGSVRHYSMADGLPDDFITVARRDPQGALWFGTRNGLARLLPEPESAPAEPRVLIGGLHVAGVRRPLSELGQSEVEGLELPHTRNNVRVEFFSLSFASGERVRYQYKLEGADADWSAPAEQRTVNYANLAPGDYRFLVRAAGSAAARPASVSFRVLPPFWRRWWFILLAAAFVVASLGFVGWYREARALERLRAEDELRKAREERLAELERVRRRIATDLHDDIGASLSQISIMSEVLSQRVGRDDPHVLQPLSLIASSSRELVDSMSDIVWAINPQKDHLSDLTQRMRLFASDMFSARDIRFQFHSPGSEQQDVQLGANVRREVFLIFKECVNNVVRHSACARVEIEFRVESGRLSLRLSDDGRGFDTSRDSEGHGLVSMRRRAEGLGGELHIESQPGRGTTVSLAVPLSQNPR